MATLTGEPVAGASLNFTNQIVTTNSAGRWTLTGSGTASGTFGVEVTAVGYLTRKTGIAAVNGRDVTIDVIRDAPPFNLAFYRQLIRDDLDAPGQLQWTKRWTTAPRFYINAFNPRTGADISPTEIAQISNAIRDVVPQATGNTYQAASIESGSSSRTTDGYIEVRITYDPAFTEFGGRPYCGLAQIATNPGWIKINYAQCSSSCGSLATLPMVTAHEVGHAMGLRHTSETGGVMSSVWETTCGNTTLSALERHHARILYARQPGNADVDWDQPSTPLLRAFLGAPPVVVR